VTPEPTDDELLAQAAACPVIRAAYATGDTEVIKRMEATHPPARCQYVKEAAAKVRQA
jgi:hypothetical protein